MITGIIYIAKCKITEKIYVGQTVKGLHKRAARHVSDAFSTKSKAYSSKFYRAIRKYGKDNFTWYMVYDNVPLKDLACLEIETISKLKSYKYGYNSTLGGETTVGYHHSEEALKKISQSSRGRRHTNATKSKMSKASSGANNAMYGKKHSKMAIKKMSQAKIGQYSGEDNPMYGKKHTEATIRKIAIRKRDSSNLTFEKANQIREKYKSGNCTQKELAGQYAVSIMTISNIIRFKTWAGELKCDQ